NWSATFCLAMDPCTPSVSLGPSIHSGRDHASRPDGNLATQTYPGGTVGTYTYDATGTATGLAYSVPGVAYPIGDSIDTDAHGDWVHRAVLANSQSYTYDAADRLTQVADTQAGQCTTRSYGYDADTNRTSLTTYAPDTAGNCQTASASGTETYAYDGADRLLSTTLGGTTSTYAYDTQGNTTTTPAADAGSSGNLTATYNANNTIATQTQGDATTTWQYDPQADRAATYTSSGLTVTNHYSDGTDNPTWTSDSGGGWTRNIQTPSGLAAQTGPSGTILQLVNLHGDVMATVDATTNAVTATLTYQEFGANEQGAASSGYGWLGGYQRATTQPSGQTLMGVRTYNPNTGRFNQVDPVTGGSANAYDYVDQNPATGRDLAGTSGRNGLSCWSSTWWAHCRLYLSEYRTQLLIQALNWGAGLAAACAGHRPRLGHRCGGGWRLRGNFGRIVALLRHSGDNRRLGRQQRRLLRGDVLQALVLVLVLLALALVLAPCLGLHVVPVAS
ncbi:RHS repeat-associated core domain-containing protein, partial [Streptomyces sp. NPDC002513]